MEQRIKHLAQRMQPDPMEGPAQKLDQNKVLLGLSGGVDSTTAALLLKEKGYTVVGYYFDTAGAGEAGSREAAAVASQLGIDFIEEDVSAAFRTVVIDHFCSEYLHGRTPNPCIVCNPGIKFRKLIETANRIGAYYIATGHYARIHRDQARGLSFVQQGCNGRKDQSYMLYRLTQDVLQRLLFPLGEIQDKAETRELARSANLTNAEKKDSQEICFIPDDDYVAYLEQQGYVSPPGAFVDGDGHVLGTHGGITRYTLGQRKGLGIALGKPAFVIEIDPVQNQVVLGDNEDLFQDTVFSDDHVFAAGNRLEDVMAYDGMRVTAKVRYSARPAAAVLHVEPAAIQRDAGIGPGETGAVGESRESSGPGETGENGRTFQPYLIRTVFEEPQRAATPGQSIVFYDGDRVIGGGFIRKSNHG